MFIKPINSNFKSESFLLSLIRAVKGHTMIASLAIAVILGTSVIFGEKLSCADVQRRILNSLQTSSTITVVNPDGKVDLATIQFRMGNVFPIQHSNFDAEVIIRRIETGYSDNIFAVGDVGMSSDEGQPTITVKGKQYNLQEFEVGPVADDAAYFRAVFIESGHTTSKTAVVIYVPIIISEDEDDPDKNFLLTIELIVMKNLTPTNQGFIFIAWLKTLLGDAKGIIGHSGVFMTHCQTIGKDASQWSGLLM